MKVDVIQNSAISFSVCVDNIYNNLDKLLQHLKAKFKVTCHENVSFIQLDIIMMKQLKTIRRR